VRVVLSSAQVMLMKRMLKLIVLVLAATLVGAPLAIAQEAGATDSTKMENKMEKKHMKKQKAAKHHVKKTKTTEKKTEEKTEPQPGK